VLDDDGTAIALLGFDGSVHHLNQPMLDLIGESTMTAVTAGSPAASILRSFLDQLPLDLFRGGHAVWRGRVDHRTMSGRHLVLRITASTDPSPGQCDLALLLHDITDTEAELAELAHRETHDPLTGLMNRSKALRHLADAVNAQRHRPGHVAAVVVDLDHFAHVNDVFDHRVGDQLLTACAERLALTIRPGDELARVGGDGFLIVAENVTDTVAAFELAERAGRALSGRLRLGDIDLELSVSVGVALTHADLLDRTDEEAAARLIDNAESAADDASRSGGGRCAVFTSQMRISARSRAEMARALAHSIALGELELAYQPIRSVVSRAAVGAEALVRWNHAPAGPVDAATVVAVAEEAGSIRRLGEFVLDRALADLAAWRRTGLVDNRFGVHVNVSRAQLAAPSFVDVVTDRLRIHGLPAHQLVLEVRESPLLSSQSGIVRTIRALRRVGVQVAIDDFGTGASALAVLTEVGVDVLKLDGTLALPSGSSLEDSRVVRSVIALAHALEMRVVAERVSTIEQLHRLRTAGCDMLQGNLVGPPEPAGDTRFTPTSLW
jgi:diguanylate cyclase (GGDEF)-like protein